MNNTLFHVCDHKITEYLENTTSDTTILIIPFSDPIAEEPEIQTQCTQSLKNGFTLKELFSTLKKTKYTTTLFFKTYANVIYSYGKEKFIEECKKIGITGLIIPDLPFEEKEEFIETCNHFDICLVPIVASSSLNRISKIAPTASNYIYLTYRDQDQLEKVINEIKKYTNAYIIKS